MRKASQLMGTGCFISLCLEYRIILDKFSGELLFNACCVSVSYQLSGIQTLEKEFRFDLALYVYPLFWKELHSLY
jgi:hypothetical protein